MAKEEIGKVVNTTQLMGINVATIMLTQPLNSGDIITFDGWSGTDTAKNMRQGLKKVESANPGKVELPVSMPVGIGAKIYRVTGEDAVAAQAQPQGGSTYTVNNNTLLGGLGYGYGNNAYAEGAFKNNIGSTSTEFLQFAPKYATTIKAKSMGNFYVYVGIFLLLFLSSSIDGYLFKAAGIRWVAAGDLIITGVALVYVGFKKFSLQQQLSATPQARIDAATYSLNKMVGRLVPYNAGVLKAPISGGECVYYSIGLFYANQVRNAGTPTRQGVGLGIAGNTQTTVQLVYLTQKGIPTLFTDGAGYLAIDFAKAPNIEVKSKCINVLKRGVEGAITSALNLIPGMGGAGDIATIVESRRIAEELKPVIESAIANGSQVDFSGISDLKFINYFDGITGYNSGINFTPTNAMSLIGNQNRTYTILVEQYLPTDVDYTCFGAAADINKSIEGKPVKVLVPDPQRGLMSLLLTPSGKEVKKLDMLTIANFGLGALFLLIGIAIAA